MANKNKLKEGDRFGRLTTIYKEKVRKEFKTGSKSVVHLWYCKCECGNLTKGIETSRLTSGNTRSCGCLRRENSSKLRWMGVGEIGKTYWHLCKGNATKGSRNLEFNITLEYMWDLFIKQRRKCALSGVELRFSRTLRTKIDTTASLDRIDSKKEYIVGNVQWVHKDVNKMKQDLPEDRFIKFCGLIFQNKNK